MGAYGDESGSGEPAAPRRQSLLRSQARCALLPAATPRVRAAALPPWYTWYSLLASRCATGAHESSHGRPPPDATSVSTACRRDIGTPDHVRSQAAAPAARAAITRTQRHRADRRTARSE